ncbi:TetR/AcrR family transcriptional regulator [Actinophytocola sp.]|uniref:TetR/AcrR family transcriptional regulator n=1 Tax=Actinophytocola sp. TaxID=1872138 RepID=UPI00389AB9A6
MTERTNERVNQKRRTYNAILAAAVELTRAGEAVTMPEVARAALVSEATAYRHFPDLVTLVRAAMDGLMPTPDEALRRVADSTDPVERIAAVTEHLLRHVAEFQGAVRTSIAAAITRPALAAERPGLRFGLIDAALTPLGDEPGVAQLKRDLAVVVSAEALFCLTDLCGMAPESAITSIVHTATTLTRAHVGQPSSLRGGPVPPVTGPPAP